MTQADTSGLEDAPYIAQKFDATVLQPPFPNRARGVGPLVDARAWVTSALRARARDLLGAHDEKVRTGLYVIFCVLCLAVTAQRSLFPDHPHWTFPVFRASFWHLVHQQNLYGRYAERSIFKYSPTAALLFAPLAVLPFAPALLLWNVANVAALVLALDRLLVRRAATLALLLLLPEIFAAMQASQSNSLVAALIVLGFVELERGRQTTALLAIGVDAAIKIFPLAALSFALLYPRRVRAAAIGTACLLALFALPLLVTTPSTLLAQYGWWRDIESADALSLGKSAMRVVHDLLRVNWPNWPVQIAGVALLLTPLLHRDRWGDAQFRLEYLASLLVFVVLFNHQAERPSFVIAATGMAIWYVSSTREPWRLLLVLLSLAGLDAWGYLPAWAAMQLDLHGLSMSKGRLTLRGFSRRLLPTASA